jgi:hypothetical protein
MFGLIVGATTLAGKIQPGRGSRIPIMITGLLLLAVTTFYYSQRMPENPESAHWFIGHIIVIIGAMLAWGLWLEQGPDDQRPLIWIRRFLLPTVLVGELCIALAGLKQPVESPPAQFTVESSVATTIQAQSMDRQIAPVRVGLPPELIRENSGMIHHYATLTGFESLTLGRVSNYLHQAAGVDPDQVARITPVREIYDNASRFGAVSLSIARTHDSADGRGSSVSRRRLDRAAVCRKAQSQSFNNRGSRHRDSLRVEFARRFSRESGQRAVGRGGSVVSGLARRDRRPEGAVCPGQRLDARRTGPRGALDGALHLPPKWFVTGLPCFADRRLHPALGGPPPIRQRLK